MPHPRISVIIPAYNAGQFIIDAIDSIVANNYPNLQIIVIDDGSTDDTAEKARYHPAPITLIQQDNQGANMARNRGLDAVEGEIIAFLDADDMWTPNKLNIQQPLLDNADIILGKTSMMVHQQHEMFRVSLSSSLFRKTAFDTVGHFAEDLPYADDRDWMFRAREAGLRIISHDDVVLRHRRHDHNLTNNQSKAKHFDMVALKRSLERRRKSGQMEVPRFDENPINKDELLDE
jgi:glycosyltransferase involved in cell wall biosynthesis